MPENSGISDVVFFSFSDEMYDCNVNVTDFFLKMKTEHFET